MYNVNTTILYFGRAGSNGKIYDAKDFAVQMSVPVVMERTSVKGMVFTEQIGYAITSKNGSTTLTAEISMSGDHLEEAKQRITDGWIFVTFGSGYVDDSGYVRDYKMMQLILTNKPKNIY